MVTYGNVEEQYFTIVSVKTIEPMLSTNLLLFVSWKFVPNAPFNRIAIYMDAVSLEIASKNLQLGCTFQMLNSTHIVYSSISLSLYYFLRK